MNYFELLDLEQKYDLDVVLLKKNYLLKQKEYHPDLVKGNELKIKNIETSVLLNEAYKVLGDEYRRAEYLLKLNGFDLSDDSVIQFKLSTDELEEILQEYEHIEEVQELADLQKIEQQKIEAKAELVAMLTEQFCTRNFSKALDIAVRLKYLTNLVGNIKLKIRHASNRD